MEGTEATLSNIRVAGLFGTRSYQIAVDPVRPTVLTGANGTGKSTILRLVDAVASKNLGALVAAPVSELVLEFTGIGPFHLMRSESEVHISWGEASVVVTPGRYASEVPEWAARIVSESVAAGEDPVEALEDAARFRGMSLAAARGLVSEAMSGEPFAILSGGEHWDQLAPEFPALFVTDQRLVVESPRGGAVRRRPTARSSRLAVEAAGLAIASQMRRIDTEYASISQIQDRRFPIDVIERLHTGGRVEIKEVLELLEEVEAKREELRSVGLLATESQYQPDITAEKLGKDEARTVISLFLQATIEKMDVLRQLSERLIAFKSFLDARFNGKVTRFDRELGVRFALSSGGEIEPAQLSSGEQQMMVLAYEILFRASPGTLVIVDEPEISLHVLWQDTLIDHLTAMGRANNLQFLMATHSPILLGSHPELERSLDQVFE